MDSSFYTRVGEGKYEVHFETGEKWKYTLVEAACREAIDNAKPLIVIKNLVRCGECKHHEDEEPGMVYCPKIVGSWVSENWFCADGEREVQDEGTGGL